MSQGNIISDAPASDLFDHELFIFNQQLLEHAIEMANLELQKIGHIVQANFYKGEWQ